MAILRKELEVGERFGRWEVVRTGMRNNSGIKTVMCKCDCGIIREIAQTRLRQGKAKSCGLHKIPNIKHGLSHTPILSIWTKMLRRCEDERDKGYKDYGGRGIKVCEEWHDLKVFADWFLSSDYEKGLSIERIDNNGNYCPENCIFASMQTQCNNRRSNKKYTLYGETKNLLQWTTLYNINPHMVMKWLKTGIDFELALYRSIIRKRRGYNGIESNRLIFGGKLHCHKAQ